MSSLPSQPAPAAAPPCVSPEEQSAWFKKEVHPHEASLRAYLRHAYPTVRDVDDVVQESFLRMWRARLTRGITQTKSFLFQVARRLAVDEIRHVRTARTESLGDLGSLPVTDDGPNAAQHLQHREKVALVADALAQLPTRCREVFILRKFRGVPQKEIARQLGISERTVESQVTRGMKLLEAHLRSRGLDGFHPDER